MCSRNVHHFAQASLSPPVCPTEHNYSPNGAVFSRPLRRLLEQLALAHFAEHAGLAGTGHHLNARAATLRFALAAILWFKPPRSAGRHPRIKNVSAVTTATVWVIPLPTYVSTDSTLSLHRCSSYCCD
jgi:hypothetical protein